MIAVALTAMPNKDYRIPPPPIIAQASYDQAVEVVRNARPGRSRGRCQGRQQSRLAPR